MMDELEQARMEIDRIDGDMSSLFEQRMRAVAEIAAFKAEHGLPVVDLNREKLVLKQNARRVKDDHIRSYYVNFLNALIDVSKNYQHALLSGMHVAYCGVEGAFAWLAAQKIFPDGRLTPYPDFSSAYQSVLDGKSDCCVLPIENSYAGEVGQVLDLMFEGTLYVNGVYDMSVRHSLLGLPGTKPENIRTVLSHSQALEQCADYIRSHGYSADKVSNTAVAAKAVVERGDATVAAIASSETALLYGLQVLDHDINESDMNTTRFAVFSRAQRSTADDNNRFLLLFTVNNVVGALAKAVNIICAHGFNMRVLRSRPVKDVPWQYYFYVEAEGDHRSDEGRRMLTELSVCCDKLKVVGHYPADFSLIK